MWRWNFCGIECTTPFSEFGDADGKHSSVITAENFADLLGAECPNLSESDKQLLCLYAIKGSRRIHGGEQPSSGRIDMRNDLIQFHHFEQALEATVNAQRGYSSVHEYSLTQFGLSREQVYEAMPEIFERYGFDQ